MASKLSRNIVSKLKKELETFKLPEGIEGEAVLKTYRHAGTRTALERRWPDGFGVQEIVSYLVDPDTLERRAKYAERIRSANFLARLEKYTQSYTNITPNDQHSFETLVSIEMQMDEIDTQLRAGGLSARDHKDLSETQTTLSREHRLVQQALGIGRAARGEQVNIENEIRKFREAARIRIENETVAIRCPVCPESYNLGFILYHFRQDQPWSFLTNCPKCGSPIQLVGQVAFPEVPF